MSLGVYEKYEAEICIIGIWGYQGVTALSDQIDFVFIPEEMKFWSHQNVK